MYFGKNRLTPDDKLLKLNNFLLTPHIAGWTTDSIDAIARIIATNIERRNSINNCKPRIDILYMQIYENIGVNML
jgi:phosphoglycerate dehydrogenase-like enzyme